MGLFSTEPVIQVEVAGCFLQVDSDWEEHMGVQTANCLPVSARKAHTLLIPDYEFDDKVPGLMYMGYLVAFHWIKCRSKWQLILRRQYKKLAHVMYNENFEWTWYKSDLTSNGKWLNAFFPSLPYLSSQPLATSLIFFLQCCMFALVLRELAKVQYSLNPLRAFMYFQVQILSTNV